MRVNNIEQNLIDLIEQLDGDTPHRLPREQDLCAQFKVGKKKLRLAMQKLKDRGLIESTRGSGTFTVPEDKRTGCVFLVTPSSIHPYSMLCISILSDILSKRGITPILNTTISLKENCGLLTSNVENSLGAIIVSSYSSDEIKLAALGSKLKLVFMGDATEKIRPSLPIDQVTVEYTELARKAVSYLIEKGQRSIGLVFSRSLEMSERDETYVWQHEMINGYREALKENGIDPLTDWIMDVPPRDLLAAGGNAVMDQYRNIITEKLARTEKIGQRPTAIIHTELSEIHLRDLLSHLLPYSIASEDMVGLMASENLETGFVGIGSTAASCYSIREMADQAVDLLLESRERPINPRRVIMQNSVLWERRGTCWSEMSADIGVMNSKSFESGAVTSPKSGSETVSCV